MCPRMGGIGAMDAQTGARQHFRQMCELAEALAPLPAEIRDHRYRAEVFGAWSMVLRYNGVRMQLTFEARDEELTLRCSTSRKPPDKWGPNVWSRPHHQSRLPIAEIVLAIEEAAAASRR